RYRLSASTQTREELSPGYSQWVRSSRRHAVVLAVYRWSFVANTSLRILICRVIFETTVMAATRKEEQGVSGSTDFEAPTKVVHGGPQPAGWRETSLNQSAAQQAAGRKNNGLGEATGGHRAEYLFSV